MATPPAPAPKRRRKGRGPSDSQETQKPADVVTTMSGVPANRVEPVPEFDAAEGYFHAPLPPPLLEDRDPVQASEESLASPLTAAEVGTEWLREHSKHWNYIPPSVERAVKEANARVIELAQVVSHTGSSLTAALKTFAKKADKLQRKYGDNPQEGEKALAAINVGIKRSLADAKTSMQHITSALSLLAENHFELARRERQSLRTMTVHSRLHKTYQPDVPGSSLVKDPFINV